MTDFDTACRVLAGTLADLDRTLLHGWPFDEWPTNDEAVIIESTFHELSLHEPDLSDQRRWYLAGQIVARLRRDGTEAVRALSHDSAIGP